MSLEIRDLGKLQTATEKVYPTLEDLTITPTTEEQHFKSTDYYGYDNVTCEAINLQSKEVNPTKESQVVEADEGYVGLSQVTINEPSLQTKEVNPILETQTITADEGYVGLSQVTINTPSLQSKEVTPTTSNQTITADNNYVGLSSVQVNGVTSAIDSNIQASNIKNGVEILGVSGNYKGEKYAPNYISFYVFSGTSLLEETQNLDTSNLTTMSRMFEQCSNLTEVDVSQFNTSNVTNMFYTFFRCEKLTYLDLSHWDTSKVTNFDSFLDRCYLLENVDVTGFDTSSANILSYMFGRCQAMTELNLSSFDTSHVTKMDNMFLDDIALQKLDLSSFDTRNVTTMANMMRSLNNLTEIKFGANWVSTANDTITNQTTGTWTNSVTGVSYTGLQALLEAGRTLGAIEGTWIKS